MTLREIGIFAVALALSLSTTQWLPAAQGKSDNPYNPSIPSRNAFNLSDPAPPPKPKPKEEKKEPEPPPKIDVKLTGLAQIAGVKRVYFAVPKEDDPKNMEYITLEEKQGKRGIEVLEIDPQNGIVRILNNGRSDRMSINEEGDVLKVARGGSSGGSGGGGSNSSSGGAVMISSSSEQGSNSNSDSNNGNGSDSSAGGLVIGQTGSSGSNNNNNNNNGGTQSSSSSSRNQNSSNRGNDQSSGRSGQGGVATLVGSSGSQQEKEPQVNGEEKAARQAAEMLIQREQNAQEGIPMPPVPGVPMEGSQGGQGQGGQQ